MSWLSGATLTLTLSEAKGKRMGSGVEGPRIFHPVKEAGKLAVPCVSEAMERIGGNAYIEESPGSPPVAQREGAADLGRDDEHSRARLGAQGGRARAATGPDRTGVPAGGRPARHLPASHRRVYASSETAGRAMIP